MSNVAKMFSASCRIEFRLRNALIFHLKAIRSLVVRLKPFAVSLSCFRERQKKGKTKTFPLWGGIGGRKGKGGFNKSFRLRLGMSRGFTPAWDAVEKFNSKADLIGSLSPDDNPTSEVINSFTSLIWRSARAFGQFGKVCDPSHRIERRKI